MSKIFRNDVPGLVAGSLMAFSAFGIILLVTMSFQKPQASAQIPKGLRSPPGIRLATGLGRPHPG